jgi:hypothetical protein
MRRAVSLVLYALYLCAFVVAVDYFVFWRPFRAGLREVHRTKLEAPRHVDDLTMRRVGSLRADRTSAFARFDVAKRDGDVRLCALGDSFTYGDEVADGHDYPALLSRLFSERGITNVEVLNFGNSWHGFHQTYFLWDGVGRRFGCDIVLLGPDGFQPERDTTLNHTGLGFPYYLHARFVLDGGGVRAVDVPGTTADERFDAYYAFVPHRDVLRYDRNAPAFLRAVVPPPRELANPFYYHRGDLTEEAHATYERLLRRFAGDGVPAVVLHSRPEIVALVERVGAPELIGVLAPRTERYPYAALGGHYSAFGNRMIAEQYFASITHGTYRPTLLELERVPAQTLRAAAAAAPPAPVSSYDSIELRMAGRPAGLLAIASTNPGQRTGTAADLHGSGVVSLLALVPPGASAVDAAIVPVRAALHDGDPLVLRAAGSSPVEITLGAVRLFEASVAFGLAEIAGLELVGEVRLHPSERVAADAFAPGAEVTLEAGAATVLRGRAGDWPLRLAVADARDRLRNFRVGEGEHVDVERLAPGGVVHLAVRSGNEVTEVPIATWRMRRSEPFAGARALPRRIAFEGAHAVVSASAPPALDDGARPPANWPAVPRDGGL